jgi:excisionase family DNA binding protein
MMTEKDLNLEIWQQLNKIKSQLLEVENSISQLKEINHLVQEKDKYLDVSNSCRFLGVGRNTIYALMREGKIAYTTLGRQRRILISDLKKYANSNYIQSKKSIL